METLRAFVVEDNPALREQIVAALEDLAPVQVIGVAGDEPGACTQLGNPETACELVIVDLFLTRGSGFDVLQRLRASGHAAHRVVLSNWINADVREHCRRLGASRVFDKSVQFDELLAYCRELADQHAEAPAPGTPA